MQIDVGVRTRATTQIVTRRFVLLAALTIATVGILWYGFVQGSGPKATMPEVAELLWLVAAILAASATAVLMAPIAKDRPARWARLLRLVNEIPAIWFLLTTACVVSFVVAQVANTRPMPHNYWPLFGIWGAAVLTATAAVIQPAIGSFPRWHHVRVWAAAHRWELLLVAALTIVAFILRIINLSSVPAPYSGDEAAMAHDAVHVLESQTRNMFMSGLQGHATMQYFLQAGFLKIFGTSVFATRLISVVAGTITIPLFFLFLRQMFGRTVGFLGAMYLVGYHLQLHFSRVALENISDPLLMIVVLYYVWRASRNGKLADFALAGLIMGLGLYLSPASRVVPAIVLAFLGYCVLRKPAFLKQAIPGLGLMALAYGVAALPVGVFWFTYQNEFMDRINIVGIFQSGWIDRQMQATGDSKLAILWQQAVHSFGAFGYYADQSAQYLTPISLIDRLSLLPFLLGLAYAVYRFLDERYALLLMIFVAVVVTGGILTTEVPTSQRLLGTVPAVAALVAIGVKLIADAASRWRPQASTALAGFAMGALVIANAHFYFGVYASGNYYSDLNTRVAAQVVDYVETLPEETRLFWYGDPRMYLSGGGHPAMTFPLRDRPRFDVLRDGRVMSNPNVPLVGDAPSTFMFMSHRLTELKLLMASCPGGDIGVFYFDGGRAGLSGIQGQQVSFIAYQVLAPNECVPLTTQIEPHASTDLRNLR